MPRIPLSPRVKLWAPPLIVIPAMLAWGIWGGDSARFILFTHHLFWFVSIMVLVYSISALVFPDSKKKTHVRGSSQNTARRAFTKKVTVSASSLAERLAILKKQKDTVDQELAQLQRKRK